MGIGMIEGAPAAVRTGQITFSGKKDAVKPWKLSDISDMSGTDLSGAADNSIAQEVNAKKYGPKSWRKFKSTVRLMSYAMMHRLTDNAEKREWYESRLIFQNRLGSRKISDIADPGLREKVREVVFPATDGLKIHGWFVKPEGDRPVVVYSSGKAGQMIQDSMLDLLVSRGFGVLAYDYRGYGKSEGIPSEKGVYRDLEGAVNFVKQQGYPRLMLWGYSLGAGVAAEIAARRPFEAVILQSGFTSLAEVTRNMGIRSLFVPKPENLQSKFDTESKIHRITSPLLKIHGGRDGFKAERVREMFEKAEGAPMKQFHKLEDAGHWIEPEAMAPALDGFLAALPARQSDQVYPLA